MGGGVQKGRWYWHGEEARAPQALQAGVGRGLRPQGPLSGPSGSPWAGLGPGLAQGPVGREELAEGVWEQLLWASRVRL